MNKYVVLGLIILTLVLGGGYLSHSSADSQAKATPDQSEDKMTVVTKGSRYLPYTQAVYDSAQGKRIVFYFYATWCPSCQVANTEFMASPEKIPEDVLVLRINYNDPDTDQLEKNLATKYGITYQHTFVQVDSQGRELVKWNGGGITELLAKLK
jgi:thiol-disulfide isomerase/thioredoxin